MENQKSGERGGKKGVRGRWVGEKRAIINGVW